MATVGLFGLGNMGAAIASRLAPTGEAIAFDPDQARRAAAREASGIDVATEPADAVADIVVLSLPNPAVSRSVVEQIASVPGRCRLVIETSTVNPSDAVELSALAGSAGCAFIDAAILSGVSQMYAGTATLLLGGAEADIAAAEPILRAISARQQRFGPVGAGMAAKVINNAVAHAVMVVLAEAGALAVATGVDGHDLAGLLTGPDAGLTRPLTHRYVERILTSSYDGGMPTEAARKDSTLALALAQQTGVPLFAIQAAHSVYEIGVGAGLARHDYAAIATLWEQWTGRPMASTPAVSPSPSNKESEQ